jgi:aspartate--ammonia ligase
MTPRQDDLAGPGIGDYQTLAELLPSDYQSLLDPKETQRAIMAVKRHIEDGLCEALDLMMVTVPLIVEPSSGVNDTLDRDGSRTPVSFHIHNDGEHTIDAEVVQAATKWKRVALKQFGMQAGEGLCTDMRAIRKDYFLDHDHSAYVDQWDWEIRIEREQRNLEYLEAVVRKIWEVLKGAERFARELFPALADERYPPLPDELTFVHAEEIFEAHRDLPRKERETIIAKQHGAVFIHGIGYPLAGGAPHELRAPDYDDWITEVTTADGRTRHGLNGDILVWNPVTQRRHELSSMGVRVDADSLRAQLAMSGQSDMLSLPYHRGIVDGTLPLSIGGGIGQSRVLMLLLHKAHIGEVSATVWPEVLKTMCRERNIHVIE